MEIFIFSLGIFHKTHSRNIYIYNVILRSAYGTKTTKADDPF